MFYSSAVLDTKIVDNMRKLKHEEIYAFYFKKIKGKVGIIDYIKFGEGNRRGIDDVDYEIALNKYKSINAHSLVIVHNHPKQPFRFSKKVTPSDDDIHFTNHIKSVCAKRNICFIDHVIVSKDGYYSFLEEKIENEDYGV